MRALLGRIRVFWFFLQNKIFLPSTRYLYLRWPFFSMKPPLSVLQLKVRNSCVEGGEVICFNTVSMVPSCSDLFIMGDMQASILTDLRKFMHLIATGWMMSSGIKCPPAVTSTLWS
jgi:hypothetical protein